MEKLNVLFKNCYGIKQLDYEFDFSEKSTFAIYAPNGTMKTSFAKTFMDLSRSQTSKDEIFEDRTTTRIIKDESGIDLIPEQVFVIEPYNEAFKSDKLSTLLVNKELKKKYDLIHAEINLKKDTLIKELVKASGLKKQIEETFSKIFTSYPDEFFKALLRVKAEVEEDDKPEFADILDSRIFTTKIIAFLETKDFKTKLKEYIEKYDELVDSSNYFQKGVFNHNNAAVIARNLKDNGFFKAKHSITLHSSDSGKEIKTEKELEEVIQAEKDSILNNSELSQAFEDIDKKLKANQELRSFREYLLENLKILPELSNLNGLRQKIWVSYLKNNKQLYKTLEEEYSKGKDEIEKIVKQAKQEETEWREVIYFFNKRFSVPFKLKVSNQEDVILKSDGPNIKFEFIDQGDKSSVEENHLLKILSNGEKRALYILNIIFEVQARKKVGQETIFIIDDIADSFDYKNKYAIIEYLQDISKDNLFKQIILSHNFDFFRTISSRLDMQRKHKLTTVKSDTHILLQQETYQNNPFNTWKNNLNNPNMLIASIPFVRNLAEFIGDEVNFIKLTSLLHIKNDTRSIKKSDLESIIKTVLKDKATLYLIEPNKLVIDLIYEVSEAISNDTSDNIKLENKIALSIGIRLKAEEFMIKKINDSTFINGITKHQTFKLLKKYKILFPNETIPIELLNQVNLMTPENIHINSFMYEPILDLGSKHLKKLYVDIKTLA